MTFSTVLDMVMTLFIIIAAAVVRYFQVKENIRKVANQEITKVEKKYLSVREIGMKKMNECVDYLYDNYVPVFFRPFITKEKINEIVQSTWEYVEAYAVAQTDKIIEENIDKIEQAAADIEKAGEKAKEEIAEKVEDAIEKVEEAVTDSFNYTAEMLDKLLKNDVAEIATSKGIVFNKKTTKAQLIQMIVDTQNGATVTETAAE